MMQRFRTGGVVNAGRVVRIAEGECIMFISEEGRVAGSVNRTELAAAYEAATDDEVKANLAAAGAENGMYVEDGKLVDPSSPELPALAEEVILADTEGAVEALEELGASGEPPRGGPGSGIDAWTAYAESLGVEVTDDMTRDDIVAAVDASKE